MTGEIKIEEEKLRQAEEGTIKEEGAEDEGSGQGIIWLRIL